VTIFGVGKGVPRASLWLTFSFPAESTGKMASRSFFNRFVIDFGPQNRPKIIEQSIKNQSHNVLFVSLSTQKASAN
jgi:hypothetical protein